MIYGFLEVYSKEFKEMSSTLFNLIIGQIRYTVRFFFLVERALGGYYLVSLCQKNINEKLLRVTRMMKILRILIQVTTQFLVFELRGSSIVSIDDI